MSPVRMHPEQRDVTLEVARRLVDDQFPQWYGLPLERVASSGTVYTIIRVGDGIAARFPLEGSDPDVVRTQLVAEMGAARELTRCSPVPSPEPLVIGDPGPGYLLPWSVYTWLPGQVATPWHQAGSLSFARDLAALIAGLRSADTGGRRFSGPGRGGELRDHDDWIATCLDRSEGLLDVAPLRTLWRQLRCLPPAGPDVMSHGDLIPANLLVRDGRLVGVLDGGGFAPADPALDLVAAWHLLDNDPRAELRGLLSCGEIEWERGRAWAFAQAIGLVWYYTESNPTMSALGRSTLARVTTA